MTIRFKSTSPGWERDLSNFAPLDVSYDGEIWPTVEHAFQAAKCVRADDRRKVADAASPAIARRIGKRVELRSGWDDMRRELMVALCRDKLARHAELRERIVATGDEDLVHEAPWDSFWGSGRTGKGRNELGKVYMELRSEISSRSKQ